jgi:uncharacterized membrane protein
MPTAEASANPLPAETLKVRKPRLHSIDQLRGLVMVIMVLDHARDYFSNTAMKFDPTDLSHTTSALFLTRWITHFCAPVFVFLAGAGAFLGLGQGKSRRDISVMLLTRGLWLIFLEVFVISPLGWSFNFTFGFTRLQVIWAIGVGMILLAGSVWLPSRLVGFAGAAMVAIHNAFDSAPQAWWKLLHAISFLRPDAHHVVASLYPLVPWVGVLAAGFGFGEVFLMEPSKRKRWLLCLGALFIAAFLVLRWTRVYGDPAPWSTQPSLLFTLLSFVKVNKYPPSLLYLLMTLGPALLFLAFANGWSGWIARRLGTVGRVPLFFYLIHLPLVHGLAVIFAWLRYGHADFAFQDFMALRSSAHPLPPDYGYSLVVVWAVWIGVVFLLYPACARFAEYKRTHTERWLTYL